MDAIAAIEEAARHIAAARRALSAADDAIAAGYTGDDEYDAIMQDAARRWDDAAAAMIAEMDEMTEAPGRE